MTLTLIAAHDPNLVIGKNGALPWHYPEDLRHFKQITTGQTIIMGRGVFEELNENPLPNRKNIVLSTSKHYEHVPTYASLQEALIHCQEEEVFIIGGGKVYQQTLPNADRLIITLIKKEYEGDTYFPEYRDKIGTLWHETAREDHPELSFLEYRRIGTF